MNDKSLPTIVPVVLCGGAGSRLWPMSRDDKPKQFHALTGNKSLLVETLDRMPPGTHGDVRFDPPCVIGSAGLRGALVEALAGRPEAHLVLEPAIRDTAAAVAACTALYADDEPGAMLIVLPSDARIIDVEGFRRTVARAAHVAAQTDAIMTIGITPSRAETQYGYIETGDPLGEGIAVRRFREKPDAQTARDYLQHGGFLWNAGIFLFRAGRMADEFRALQPQIWEKAVEAVRKADRAGGAIALDPDAFGQAERISIDYAIMEKTTNIGVVPAQFDWDDLGSWAQLHDHADKDGAGNAMTGTAIAVEASGNFVRADDAVVALAGVDDLVVVAEDGKVLVTRRDRAHLVKKVTQAAKARLSGDIAHDRSPAAIRDWLFGACLPFWAEHGIDRAHGGVHEALDFAGRPAPHDRKRLRVLARQIYVFAHAEHMGWTVPDGLLESLFATLTETGWHADGGFIHLFNPDGSVQDPLRDTYDQAFVLLAMAWLWRVRKWPEAWRWADRTLDYLDEQCADAIHGGYAEDSSGTLPRRANPHMHLLEAMLAWYDATEEEAYLDRAEALVDLFQRHFFDPATGSLTEFFDADWTPRAAPVEPGHHYEWAWLLAEYGKRRPREGLGAQARALFATAHAFGHHAVTGAAADTMMADGSGLSARARCWPQTEALKAAVAMGEAGVTAAGDLRTRMVDVLFDHYLGRPFAAGYVDAIDAAGKPVAADVPSSTLYHIVCALSEHLRPGED